MSAPMLQWVGQAWQRLRAQDLRIGPGKLVLVVGPSGAGKDTLIDRAREHCRNDPDIVFPRRIVTRTSQAGEDHDSIDEQEFRRRLDAGQFALFWQAHGLAYAIPQSIDHEIRRGRTVICNVSRTIVEPARERYSRAVVVMITAPAAVLAQRLAARGRETAEAIAARLARPPVTERALQPDIVIDNNGSLERGGRWLVEAIYQEPPPIGL